MKENIDDFKTKIITVGGGIIDCLISSTKISDNRKTFKGYQGIIKNITRQEEVDNLILKTIIDTQEKERSRFAIDIHDSLGQQLSAVKFHIGTLSNAYNLPVKRKDQIVKKSNDAVVGILSDLRDICFNLMPRTLQEVNLKAAVNELCSKISVPGKLAFRISIGDNLQVLSKHAEFAIFRIVQEFINNAIKHGQASIIHIKMTCEKKKLIILLKDNGRGFKINEPGKKEGMGLLNVRSRVRSCHGTIAITSMLKKGCSYLITIPTS